MGNPFTSTSVTSYNSNPPPDDGSTGANNIVAWSTIKTKLPDPIKTAFDTSETNTNSAFAKVMGGGGMTSTGTNYTILLADQGKFVRATASAITITTPDATSVGSPFVCVVMNNSTGSITLAGNNPGVQQNIDGSASVTLAAGAGVILNTDGSNWFTGGQQGIFVGKQMMYGQIINGTIVESNAANAVTFSLKTLAGADPSSSDPVLLCFRNATTTTGNFVFRSVAAATSLTISAGSTLGTVSATPCRLWLVLFDDAGTVRMGAINCVSGTSIYPLGQTPIASSTAEGGAGAADSAQVFYTGTAVTSKPYLVLGYATYNLGLSTAGNWNVDPILELFGHGQPLPGHRLQSAMNETGAVNTGTAAGFLDDTIPQSSEATMFMTQAITPVSAANILDIYVRGSVSHSTAGVNIISSLFQDSGLNALVSTWELSDSSSTSTGHNISLRHRMIAGTTSSTTFKYGVGATTGSTVTFNGQAGIRKLGNVLNSWIIVEEIMA